MLQPYLIFLSYLSIFQFPEKWVVKIKTYKFINWSLSPTSVIEAAVAKWPLKVLLLRAEPSEVGMGEWGRCMGRGSF